MHLCVWLRSADKQGSFAPIWVGCEQAASQLWKEARDFNPKQQGASLNKVNILLIGGVGAGKSSIVCSVDSLCKGRASDKAPHGQGTGSLTRELRKYSFRNSETNGPVSWQLWDTMGWGVNDYKQKELEYILDGNLPDKCNLQQGITHKTPGFKLEPTLEDRVHCVCVVVPCQSASDRSYMQRLQELRNIVRSRSKSAYAWTYTQAFCCHAIGSHSGFLLPPTFAVMPALILVHCEPWTCYCFLWFSM